MKSTLVVLSSGLILGAIAQINTILPELFKFRERSVPQSGGWSLQATTCPVDSEDCGAAWCCPKSTVCVRTGDADNAEACCPSSTSCIPDLQAAPVCADSTWNLWNTTNPEGLAYQGFTGYICCLANQIAVQGTIESVGQSAICVDKNIQIAENEKGTLISGATAAVQSFTSTLAQSSPTAASSATTTAPNFGQTTTSTGNPGAGDAVPNGANGAASTSAVSSGKSSSGTIQIPVLRFLWFSGVVSTLFVVVGLV